MGRGGNTGLRSRRRALKAAIDYICNPEKTDGKLLISSYGCAAETADKDPYRLGRGKGRVVFLRAGRCCGPVRKYRSQAVHQENARPRSAVVGQLGHNLYTGSNACCGRQAGKGAGRQYRGHPAHHPVHPIAQGKALQALAGTGRSGAHQGDHRPGTGPGCCLAHSCFAAASRSRTEGFSPSPR